MFSSDTGAMVDAAAVVQPGCRTLCQRPGCGKPIELACSPFAGGSPFWRHLDGWGGEPHEATPVEPEHPGEALVNRVAAGVRLYQQGRDEGRREALIDFAAHLRILVDRGDTLSPLSIADIADRWARGER